jgi:hypothetical protein
MTGRVSTGSRSISGPQRRDDLPRPAVVLAATPPWWKPLLYAGGGDPDATDEPIGLGSS